MNSKTKGVLAILCANTIFGLNIPVTKALVSGWMTPTGYTLVRMLFGAVVFWLIGARRKSEKVVWKDMLIMRSEERRVGKECSTRWWRHQCRSSRQSAEC